MDDFIKVGNGGKKFDLQLSKAVAREKCLASDLGLAGTKIELKSESHLWKQTGNICIEFEYNARPSGIAATEADIWVHELLDDEGRLVVRYMFEVSVLRELCRRRLKAGFHRSGGDNGASRMVLLRLSTLARDLAEVSQTLPRCNPGASSGTSQRESPGSSPPTA